jgi:hypothetical protein
MAPPSPRPADVAAAASAATSRDAVGVGEKETGVCVALNGTGVCEGVCDSDKPLGSELVGVADSVGGNELDGVPSGELDTEAPVESDAVDDSD